MAEYVDIAALLAGDTTTRHTTAGGRRSDGLPLLYSEAVNVLLGAPEAGKTLIAGAMAGDELFTNGSVLWIDLDHNGAAAIVLRLVSFGVNHATLTDPARFRLAIPDDADAVMSIIDDLPAWGPTLTVVDSIGELLPMFGANSNDADDYTRVNRQVLTAAARTGSAVLAIDHEAKGNESRTYGATGTAAKKRAVDGALLRVTNVRPFTPGVGGEAVLSIVKDRHGALRAVAAPDREPTIAGFTLEARGDAMLCRFTIPAGKPVHVDDVDQLRLLTPPPTSVRDVKARLGWGSTRATAAFRDFKSVPGTPGNVPGTLGDASVPVFPTPIGGERGTLTGNTGSEKVS